MSRTIETEIFSFDELSDAAKEKARRWWRDCLAQDSDWHNFIFEDAVQCTKILGIEIATHSVKLIGGGTRQNLTIYFSGFWSQGDGASYEGYYYYAKQASKLIRKHAPQDSELHRIADCLFTIQKQAGYGLFAVMKHCGYYQHSHCMMVDVQHSRGWNIELWEDSLPQLMRDFADWIYRQLEKEFEYQNADAQVDEAIRANEYEFEADGDIA